MHYSTTTKHPVHYSITTKYPVHYSTTTKYPVHYNITIKSYHPVHCSSSSYTCPLTLRAITDILTLLAITDITCPLTLRAITDILTLRALTLRAKRLCFKL